MTASSRASRVTSSLPLTRPLTRLTRRSAVPIRRIAHLLVFFVRALAGIPIAVRQYRHEFLRLLSNITWGNGSIVVGGGTAGVAVVLGMTVGALVGIEGYNFLDLLGLGPATGFVSSLVNTRELAPLMAAMAFAMQGGCRFTAQLGSMRIAEEIDALDSIAIRPIPYLVTTRLIASVIAMIPLYVVVPGHRAISPLRWWCRSASGGSTGSYLHYFSLMLAGQECLVLGDQGDHLRLDRLDDPVLLRVLRQRRTRGCRGGRRARDAGQRSPW
ncbi:MAG: ABC transporter permease [Pseudomonas sp.]